MSLGFGVVDWRSCLDTSPDGSLVRVEPCQGTYKQFYMPTDTPSKVFQSRSFIEESGILWIWLSQPSIGVTGSWNGFCSRFLQSSRLFGALSNAWEGSGAAFIVWPFVGILNFKVDSWFLIFSWPSIVASSLYVQRVVRRSVVELSLRIFINNILQELLKPKIGNSLYSYTLSEY